MATPTPDQISGFSDFMAGPFMVVATSALKQIAQAVGPKHPRLVALGKRLLLPALPVIAGAGYALATNAVPGQGTERILHGILWGLAASGAYRTYQVAVKGK